MNVFKYTPSAANDWVIIFRFSNGFQPLEATRAATTARTYVLLCVFIPRTVDSKFRIRYGGKFRLNLKSFKNMHGKETIIFSGIKNILKQMQQMVTIIFI